MLKIFSACREHEAYVAYKRSSRPFPLLSLPYELLFILFDFLPNEALWILSMTCSALKEATSTFHVGRRNVGPYWPLRGSYFCSSLALAKWFVCILHIPPKYLILSAAEVGALNVAMWAYSKSSRIQWCVNGCDQFCILYIASRGGHLHVVKWAVSKHSSYDLCKSLKICAELGHVHIIEWAFARSIPIPYNVILTAAKFGQMNVMKWILKTYKYTLHNVHEISVTSAENGHLHLVSSYLKYWQRRINPNEYAVLVRITLEAAVRSHHDHIIDSLTK